MTPDDIPLTPLEADDALAAEYVLGVLDLPERLSAEARLRTDRAFAERVARWENRFAPLNEGYEDAPAPPELFALIEARPRVLINLKQAERQKIVFLSGLVKHSIVVE